MPFLLWVEDVFSLRQGRLVMLTGRVERGRVRKGDEVETVGSGGGVTVRVADIEQSRVRIDEATSGMNVGVLLRGIAADAVARGQVLATPGSISAHAAFIADIALLSEEQGGAEVVPGDRLHFYTGSAAVLGTVTPLHGVDVVRPLHRAEVRVVLEEPVALEEGRSFAFRHHNRAAGSGTVTRLVC
ncbi:EF-Tu/IF-2/RF-3 family GTPase [Streptomyces melanogenes]|uniref:EF-Tu/IF-2/RF-3 family GTPase n=1 Tax=Streptomyces melanogenes TaxID=67326 RepID=UPI0037B615E2